MTRYLYNTYYGDTVNAPDSDYVSSHWEHYRRLNTVTADQSGNPDSFNGTAFGTGKFNGTLHRWLEQLCIWSHLTHVPHRKEIQRLRSVEAKTGAAMGLDRTVDVFRQVCTVELLQRSLPEALTYNRINFWVFGDGYGILSSLLKAVFPNSTVTLIDIGQTLLFQVNYCQKAFSDAVHELAGGVNDLSSADFVYCPTEQLHTLERFQFDVAVTVAAFHEMNMATISRYFDFLRKCLKSQNLFYCNSREYKVLMGGEVLEFLNYPWQENDQHLMDEYCPWHRYYFSWIGGKLPGFPFAIRAPIIKLYDGRINHRLTIMATG